MNIHLASKLFAPATTGPLTLRNRTIRSTAFEGMCPGNAPSPMLLDYYRSVAAGGVRIATVAHVSTTHSGLPFPRQLWLRPEIIPGLRELTDVIHAEGAAASIQIGHYGNMSHKNICGATPISASSDFDIYSPAWVRGMRWGELLEIAEACGRAVYPAREAGFDAAEVHAGHGYPASRLLSPYTNRWKGEYGGSLKNRMRFMTMVMEEVMKAAGSNTAAFVKMSMRDGFRGGMEIEETLEATKRLEPLGGYALILSGGFVSKAPMYAMRGTVSVRMLTHYMDCWWLEYGIKLAGRVMVPIAPFGEAYSLEDALKFRSEIKTPLIYVDGLVSREKIDEVLNKGLEAVWMARALFSEPRSVNRMQHEEKAHCNRGHSNYHVGRMYAIEVVCHHRSAEKLPLCLQKKIEHLENK